MTNQTANSGVVYVLPDGKGQHARWRMCESRDFAPDEQHSIVIGAVQHALDAGCYYSSDVVKHCAEFLALSAEQIEANFNNARVEGGVFGMECYYARKCLDARRVHAAEDEAAAQLKASVGLKLGNLVFGDLRKVKASEIKAIDGDLIFLEIKIGGKKATWQTNALGIKNAINRAVEFGKRTDGFDQFCAAT